MKVFAMNYDVTTIMLSVFTTAAKLLSYKKYHLRKFNGWLYKAPAGDTVKTYCSVGKYLTKSFRI